MWWRVFRFGPQNRQHWFGDLGLKITAMVSWLGLKTKQASVYRLRHKIYGGRSARDTSRSSGLLHVEASLARVSQSGLKTDGGMTIGGARDTIMKVTSEPS
jgi:hypothetical protein